MQKTILNVISVCILFILFLFRDVFGKFVINSLGFDDNSGYLSLVLGGIIVFVYIFIVYRYYYDDKFTDLFAKQKLTKEVIILFYSTLLILKVLPMLILVGTFVFGLGKTLSLNSNLNLINIFLGGLNFILITPIIEELFFRGIVFNFLRKRLSLILSLCISSLIFALPHNGNIAPMFAIITGVILALIYEKSNSLRYPIILHSLLNLITYVNNFLILS